MPEIEPCELSEAAPEAAAVPSSASVAGCDAEVVADAAAAAVAAAEGLLEEQATLMEAHLRDGCASAAKEPPVPEKTSRRRILSRLGWLARPMVPVLLTVGANVTRIPAIILPPPLALAAAVVGVWGLVADHRARGGGGSAGDSPAGITDGTAADSYSTDVAASADVTLDLLRNCQRRGDFTRELAQSRAGSSNAATRGERVPLPLPPRFDAAPGTSPSTGGSPRPAAEAASQAAVLSAVTKRLGAEAAGSWLRGTASDRRLEEVAHMLLEQSLAELPMADSVVPSSSTTATKAVQTVDNATFVLADTMEAWAVGRGNAGGRYRCRRCRACLQCYLHNVGADVDDPTAPNALIDAEEEDMDDDDGNSIVSCYF